ncbi:MAG: Na+/H+ antiporter, partial [Catenulispora sp.]
DKEAAARQSLARAALDYIDTLADTTEAPDRVLDRLRRRYSARLGTPDDGAWPAAAYADLQRQVIGVQSTELRRLYTEGRISDGIRRRMQAELDRAEAALDEG